MSLPISAGADLPELIPREVLFGNPVKTQARISPDGKHIGWLAPSDCDVLNIWVRSTENGEEGARMITNDIGRGVRFFHWSPNGSSILYLQDKGGDENWHLYAVNLSDDRVLDLTPFEGVRAQNLLTDPEHPHEVLIGLNKRDPRVFDMYRIDLRSGEMRPDTQNPGDVTSWLTDAKFRIRGAIARDDRSGDAVLRTRSAAEKPWQEILRWPFGENGTAYGFSKNGKRVFVSSSVGSDTTRLLAVDAATGEEKAELAHDKRADVAGILMHPTEHRVEAVEFDYLKPRWQIVDEGIRKHLERLCTLTDGRLAITSRTSANDRWVVAFQPDDGPRSYYLYDVEKGMIHFLFNDRPELENYTLAKMKPIVIPSRDGFELVSYLTLPVGIPHKKLPLVLNVHGGPWMRNSWGYDSKAQWFANRGYATLQVNYRGSSGFGKRFKNAGNGEWGIGAMQHDLTDAVRWLVEQEIADPKRVCIYGRSYGGYAVLAGLTFTPNLYACGVDIVGPSHIKTLFQSIPPYWQTIKKEFILRVGDVENDKALNHQISPIFHVDRIRAPLLVIQGANDPRVNIAESEQIVSAMRANGLSVIYLVFLDEGHVFARPENRIDMNGRIEAFLARYLNGRSEPWKKVESSGQLR